MQRLHLTYILSVYPQIGANLTIMVVGLCQSLLLNNRRVSHLLFKWKVLKK